MYIRYFSQLLNLNVLKKFVTTLLLTGGVAPGGAIPGITRLRCTEGANLAVGAAAPAAPVVVVVGVVLGGTILPTGAVSLLSSFDKAPVLPVMCIRIELRMDYIAYKKAL